MNPGAIEEGAKVATGTVDALKSQPLALALIVVNLMFLAGGGYMLHDAASVWRTRETRAADQFDRLIKQCFPMRGGFTPQSADDRPVELPPLPEKEP